MEQSNNTATLRYASDPNPEQADSIQARLNLSPPNVNLPIQQRGQEVLRIATEAFAATGSWVIFFREMMGAEGVVRKLFPTPEELQAFEASNEFAELQEMIAAMRSQDNSKGDAAEPERMITIRLPKSLHDALRIESETLNLSINKLCISKLLQRIDGRFVPIQQGRRRGRRPGPQGPRSKKQMESQFSSEPPESDTHFTQ